MLFDRIGLTADDFEHRYYTRLKQLDHLLDDPATRRHLPLANLKPHGSSKGQLVLPEMVQTGSGHSRPRRVVVADSSVGTRRVPLAHLVGDLGVVRQRLEAVREQALRDVQPCGSPQ